MRPNLLDLVPHLWAGLKFPGQFPAKLVALDTMTQLRCLFIYSIYFYLFYLFLQNTHNLLLILKNNLFREHICTHCVLREANSCWFGWLSFSATCTRNSSAPPFPDRPEEIQISPREEEKSELLPHSANPWQDCGKQDGKQSASPPPWRSHIVQESPNYRRKAPVME